MFELYSGMSTPTNTFYINSEWKMPELRSIYEAAVADNEDVDVVTPPADAWAWGSVSLSPWSMNPSWAVQRLRLAELTALENTRAESADPCLNTVFAVRDEQMRSKRRILESTSPPPLFHPHTPAQTSLV